MCKQTKHKHFFVNVKVALNRSIFPFFRPKCTKYRLRPGSAWTRWGSLQSLLLRVVKETGGKGRGGMWREEGLKHASFALIGWTPTPLLEPGN